MPLKPVAHLGKAPEADVFFGDRSAENFAPLALHIRDRFVDALPIHGLELFPKRAHEIERERRDKKTDRGRDAGRERKDHGGRAQNSRDPVSVYRPGAAKGEERQTCRVFSALDRVDARGPKPWSR